MGFWMLFLTVWCIICSQKSTTRAEGSPNITLVKEYKDLWCIAQGEEAFTGLSWISSDLNRGVLKGDFNRTAKNDCNVMQEECDHWKGWDKVHSIQYPMPQVLDYRWNDLSLEKIFGRSKPGENDKLNIKLNNNLNFTISILGKHDAYIFLCEDLKSSRCYWIILGGWGNTKNLIRRCEYSQKCEDTTSENNESPLSIEHWAHITVVFSNKTKELKVLHEDKLILNYTDNKPFKISYLNVSTYKETPSDAIYFRHHNYFYLRADKGQSLKRDYYIPTEKRICFSIVYSIESASQKGYLEIKLEYRNGLYSEPKKKLEYTQLQWKHKKVEFTLEEITKVRFVITGKEGESYAIGGIMECNPDGDFTKSRVYLHSPNRVSDLKCLSLKYPKQKLQLKQPDIIKDCGNDCTVNCNMFNISSVTDCSGTIICKKIGEEPNACVCSSGFKGLYCNESCDKGYYGLYCSQKCGNCFSENSVNQCKAECGTCAKGCVEGYRLPFCKETYLYLKNAPSNCTGTVTSLYVTVDDHEMLGNGTAVKFILQYKQFSDAGSVSGWRDVGTYNISILGNHAVQNLHPETKYKIRVVLIDESNKRYSGKKVPYSNCTTTCNHPREENIKIQPSTRSIAVSWQAENYSCWRNSYQFVLEEGEKTLYSENVTGLLKEVKNLNPYKNYTWKLLYNYDKIYSKTIQTMEDAPSPPIIMEANVVSSKKVRVTWQHPNETNGKLRSFKLQIKLLSSGLKEKPSYDKTKYKNVTVYQENYTFELNDLFPASEYNMSVCGITVTAGEKAYTTVKTHIAAPRLGTYLELKEGSLNYTSFEIILPAADEFLTEQGAYIIIVTSENEIMDHKVGLMFKDEGFKEQVLIAANINNTNNSWVAAEVQPEFEKRIFTIGDNKTQTSGGHYVEYAVNQPLVMGARYQVTLVAVNRWEDNYTISYVKLKDVVQLGSETDVIAIIAGLMSLVMLLILSCSIFMFVFVKRRKLKRRESQTEPREEFQMSENNRNDMNNPMVGSTIQDDVQESEEMPDTPLLPKAETLSCRIAIDDLEQYVKSSLGSGELARQHALFPRGQTKPWDYGLLPKNKPKNRYMNLAAYDDTRVKLRNLHNRPFSDYINANYIDGYKSPKFYIATQGPKPNTIVDFWRMIWQKNVQIIAMLANITENGKIKCEKYWPDIGQELTHGAVNIMNTSENVFADYTFRVFNVSSKGESRSVHHLHFTSWPDHSVPMYPQSLASYLKKLLTTPPGSGPIVVHCSAGVGRTGTIILSDICLRMAMAEEAVDVLCFLGQIREQRINLVDNLHQYILVHLILLEYLVTEPTSYSCDPSFDKELLQELINSGKIKAQFSCLSDIRWRDQALKSTSAVGYYSPAQTDRTKNRNLNIVPEPYCRTYISPFPYDKPNSDYINAVYVDGFQVKDQFVVTQFPLESTIHDFWRLTAEKNISLIVVLNEMNVKDKSICSFWPSKIGEIMKPMSHTSVVKKHEEYASSWKIHTVDLVYKEASRQVRILHLKGWRSGTEIPPSHDVMIKLWEKTMKLYSSREPIVVCCLDGATASGYFVALAFLIEKIKLEQQCDVCQAVRTVRQSREHFVPSYGQFESLYEAAVAYLDSFQTYANFN